MQRTNTFAVRPLSADGEHLLRDLLDASAALWNEVNYERLMRYNDEYGFSSTRGSVSWLIGLPMADRNLDRH